MNGSRISLVACVTALLTALSWMSPGTLGAFSIEYEKHVLPNGLRIILAPDPSAPTVSYYTMIDAGSRDETKRGATGIAHVFEHMMFRGTEKFPDFDAVVAPMGAQTNAFTSNDMTAYYVNAKSEFLPDIVALEADRVRNLIFTNETFRTELGPVKEERRRGVDENPYGFLEQRLYDLAFDKHTYKHPVIGWEEDLEKNMTFKDGLLFKDTYYTPKYTVIVVAGGFDPEQALQLITQHYGDWEQSTITPDPIPIEPEQKEHRRDRLVWKDAMIAPILMLAHKSPAMQFATKDYVALLAVDRLLFSSSGRLRQRLTVENQLVEDIDAGVWGTKDPSLWTITATAKSGVRLDSIEHIILEEIDRLKTEPVSAEELQKAVLGFKADRIYRMDRPASVAVTLGRYTIVSGSPDNVTRELSMLEALTPADIQVFARDYLTENRRTTITLSPKAES
ncbi:MAG: pitrilysin family protein [Candidatus Zixiibacteriota bacterium]